MTRRKRLRFQNRVLLITLLTVAPFAVATTVLLFLYAAPPLRWNPATAVPGNGFAGPSSDS